ncbi:SDR family oxidoreductase [Nocardioides sp. AN3]
MTRTILLTGASGVVGQALLPRLLQSGDRVIPLVHRNPVANHGVSSLHGDIAAPTLGLSEHDHAELAREVDVVVHAAAVTDFNRADGTLEATNIEGTRNIVAFAEAADALLYHVSTAFVGVGNTVGRGEGAAGYAASKAQGEDVVRRARVPHVILRPSVVIGDATTGEMSTFQGLHQVVQGLFNGLVPIIPFDAAWPIDFIPNDVVADCIATVVEKRVTEGEFWLTAGDRALRLDDAMDVAVAWAHECGVMVDTPRFVTPDMWDRLIAPVFLDELPPFIAKSVTRMLEFFTTYLQDGRTKPSSLRELEALGAMPLPDQQESLAASLHYWADVKGHHQCGTSRSAA